MSKQFAEVKGSDIIIMTIRIDQTCFIYSYGYILAGQREQEDGLNPEVRDQRLWWQWSLQLLTTNK